jgi:hypothetical protein
MLPMYGEALPLPLPLPCSIEIFWSWVIGAMSCATRCDTGAVEPAHGQEPLPPLPAVNTANSHSE